MLLSCCFNLNLKSFGSEFAMDNIQQIADALQKGRASVQQGRTRPTRLRTELCSDSFHAVLVLNYGPAKCQCNTTTVTVVVYCR